ncbi:MAG: PAS domain-containing hybrid sensor histidine kinase/response regulator [Ilumatobacteraceae bacterium]
MATDDLPTGVFDSLQVGVWTIDPDGVSTYVNDHLLRLTGLDRTQVVGAPVLEYFHPDDRHTVLDHMRLRRMGASDAYDARLLTRTGDSLHVRIHGSPLLHGGEFVGSVAVVTDLTDLSVAAAERDRALQAAEDSGISTTRFVSWVSHELRTPLNAIAGFAQLLEARLTDTAMQQMAANIVTASSHVMGLVQDLLDYSKADADMLAPQLDRVSMRDVIDECLTLGSGHATDLDVTITTDVVDEWVTADRRHLVQALLNLLSNAVKYGGRGTTVRIVVTRQADRVLCAVTDQGPGIPPELQQRIFRPFERLGGTGAEGVGLGLSIAESFVRAMHGSLTLSSPDGLGATFTIDLPAAATPGHDSPPPTPPEQLANQLVLYVEDEPLNASLVESIVGLLAGRSLHVEPTVAGGIEAFHRLRPALVLLDLNLPDGTGFDVLAVVRNDAELGSTPVYILSADATEQATSRAHELGADRFITKPFDLKEFIALLEAATPGA